ncbi:hypothetical protein WICMUC_003802 [Wickerhamomyces mucosus]|uniref:DNA-directed RNA polymerase III subunit n=1 Tax=Wickerhamomyces mucosus TaxID=1378264 RepID=A0A9P8PKY8_9ASCO|nr:hypothetical protein WICMUC_003802 [Wickerhamomyces mucosus]
MSFRGGRGGGGGFQRNLPFGLDYNDINSANIECEKPQIPLPVNGLATNLEKITATHFINFQSSVRDGPFFTGSNLDSNKKSNLDINDGGINDGLKRYSDKYMKKRKIGPSIDDHPYVIEFFPQELYKVMGVDDKKKKKLLNLSKLKNSKELLEKLENNEVSMLEQLKNSLNDDDDGKDDDEPQPEFDENIDDEFEEDEDDDYNAEKYFDDGEDFGDLDDYDDEAAF